MKRLISLISVSLMCLLTQANTVTQTIRGVVMDKQTKVTLPGANIILTHTNPNIGISSGENGEFRIENVQVGRVSLMITYVGYHDVVMNNINLQAGKELVLNIYMDEKVFAVDEVVISHTSDKSSPTNRMATVSARSFSVEETERYAGSRNDPARMAANFAGVVGVDDSRNDIIIRGNSPMGLLWRLEGVDIPSPNHWGMSGSTGGPVSMLNNTLLENSDFYTGAFPAEYGNALSGVFDLKMRNGNNEQYEFLAQIGFNGFELGAEGPISKSKGSSFLVNYRYSTLAVFDALGMDFGTIGVPKYQDLSFKLNFPTTRLGHISVFGLGGMSKIEIWESRIDTTKEQINFYGGEGFDITSGTNMGTIGVSSHYTVNPNTYVKSSIAVMGQKAINTVDTLSVNLEKFRFYNSSMIDNRIIASSFINHRFNSRNTLKGGVSAKLLLSNLFDEAWYKEYNGFRDQTNYDGNTWILEPYVQWQYRPTERLTINTGLHYNFFALNNSSSLEPRLGMKYSISAKHSVSLGYGLHSQISPLFVYFLQDPQDDDTYIEPNTNLGLTKSHHLVAGYDVKVNLYTRIKFETYYQYIFDAPVDGLGSNSFSILNSGASFVFGMPSPYLSNGGTGENYGIELTVERFLNKGLYFLVTTSLFESKYTGGDKVLHNTAFNNNYVVNGLFGKEFNLSKNKKDVKRTLAFDIKSMIAGGKRTTPWTAVLNEETQKYEQEWDYDKAFSTKLSDYIKIDFKVAFRSNKRGVTQEWGIEITNLLNYKNIQGETFNETTGKSEFVYQTSMMAIPQWRIIF
ncbi:MAG: TonB-dependent receptor [Bacteroidales bacterium]|nr:TonB-dependent receptor [Bacteroidales bacterium]MDY0197927.1 TonB-dependent receptor [Tenuifilaceae bacterium]